MKLAILAATLAAGCVHPLVATSQSVATPAESAMTIPHPLGESEQLVIEKLSLRGFTLVDRKVTAASAELRLQGNRDFWGALSIGSVFYASIAPISRTSSRITLVGKPTVGHLESCPSLDGRPCTQLMVQSDWGVSGREEADVIRGVFAELDLEATIGSMGSAP